MIYRLLWKKEGREQNRVLGIDIICPDIEH